MVVTNERVPRLGMDRGGDVGSKDAETPNRMQLKGRCPRGAQGGYCL